MTSRIPFALKVEEFLERKADWEKARRRYIAAQIVFEAFDKLRRLEEKGPGAFPMPCQRTGRRNLR